MTLERRIADAFKLNDDTWMNHANPWSVGTRFTTLPLLMVAIWSRTWLGWWSLLPITLATLWIWINPRIFPKPKSTHNWGSKATFGERIWLNRDRHLVPLHHRRVPNYLSLVSTSGIVFAIWGLVAFNIWTASLGVAIVILGKLWFCDRMVWLYEDLKNTDPTYQQWLY